MKDINVQIKYWDGAAASKTFTHPIPLLIFRDLLLPPTAKIMDYGCGYGRTCSELTEAGYQNVIGIDISEEMIKRGRCLNGNLDLRVFDGRSTDFEDRFFDACILLAVLTSIPSDDGQEYTIGEIYRLLRPGGLLFISDYPLQADARNQKRYHKFKKEFGIYGMFRTEGAVFRHFEMRRKHQLLSGFEMLRQDNIRACTMNCNESDVFQIMALKK
jgi:SAM-dependent methyltransferase